MYRKHVFAFKNQRGLFLHDDNLQSLRDFGVTGTSFCHNEIQEDDGSDDGDQEPDEPEDQVLVDGQSLGGFQSC